MKRLLKALLVLSAFIVWLVAAFLLMAVSETHNVNGIHLISVVTICSVITILLYRLAEDL